jgi:hypothetical protein
MYVSTCTHHQGSVQQRRVPKGEENKRYLVVIDLVSIDMDVEIDTLGLFDLHPLRDAELALHQLDQLVVHHPAEEAANGRGDKPRQSSSGRTPNTRREKTKDESCSHATRRDA